MTFSAQVLGSPVLLICEYKPTWKLDLVSLVSTVIFVPPHPRHSTGHQKLGQDSNSTLWICLKSLPSHAF